MGKLREGACTERTVMLLDRLRGVFPSDAGVAKAVGVSPSQLSRWRKGQTRIWRTAPPSS